MGAVNDDGAAALVSVNALVAALVITTSPGFGVPVVVFATARARWRRHGAVNRAGFAGGGLV